MDLSKYDETQLHHKWRRQCWRNGNRVKTRRWLDKGGAKRDTSENKITRSVYRKTMKTYWSTLDWRVRERAERMSIYVNYLVPEEGACDFLEKARCKALGGARHRGPPARTQRSEAVRLGRGKHGGN